MAASKTWPRWLKIALEVLFFFLLVVLIQWWAQRDAATGSAPAIQGHTLDGAAFSLEQLRGRETVVHFWGSWCPICRAEEGMIDSLAEDLPMITVAIQSGEDDEVQAYMKKAGLGFPVINDPEGELAARYGVRGVPASFILDSEGEIRFVETGFTSKWGLQVRLWLTRF